MNTSNGPATVLSAAVLRTWAAHDWRDGLNLGDLSALDRIMARTNNSIYEIVVVSPMGGDVLVRGGRFFPEFTPAHLAGASLGGSLLKMRSMHIGFRVEFACGGRVVITSPVCALAVKPASVGDVGVM